MLESGHLDQQSTQFCSDLSKEKLKRMMLNQDLVHMGQVLELHRLYRIQIAMAEDIKEKGLGNHNSHVRDINSNPANLNNQVNRSMGCLRSSTPACKQKPLDLQLSADDFIRQSSGEAFRPFESKNKGTVGFDLNLSLNIGEERRSWLGKRTCANPPEIIDLEDPNSKYSNRDAVRLSSVFSPPNLYIRGNPMSERTVISDKRNTQIFSNVETRHRHGSDGSSSSRPFTNANKAYQRPPSCDSGIIDKSIPRRATMLDLNKIHIEDLADLSNTHSEVVNPLANASSQSTFASSASPTAAKELHIGNYAEIPNIHVQNNPNSGANIIRDIKPRDNNSNNKGKVIYIDLDSDTDEEHCSSGSGPKIESVGSSSKVSDGLSSQFETSQVVAAEEIVEMDIKPCCENLLISEQPDHRVLLNSSQTECATVQGGVNGGDSKFTSDDDSQLSEIVPLSKTPEQRFPEIPDLNSVCFKSKKSDVDEEVTNAAQLLVGFFLRKAEKITPNVIVRKEHDQPQWPPDSYEAMVLNAKECGPEDYCISSNAFDVDVSEKKDSRSKLKRGRSRTKDFQTEVLLSLSTLARHEIREDINAFQGALRSREYKRRAKMSGAGDWSTPTRGKRSRISRR